MIACTQRPYCKRTMPLVRKITFKQFVEVLFQWFKTLQQVFERNFADLEFCTLG